MNKFYSLKRILETGAQYNIIIGQRSNGKTYAALEHVLRRNIESGVQFAYVRRYREDLRAKRGDTLFNPFHDNGLVAKLCGGRWDRVVYRSSRWYLAVWDEQLDTMVVSEEPIGFAFALSESEHNKSASFPGVKTVIFDEFLSRGFYLPDEFMLFMNTLSTIIRTSTDVKIFMLGNTVNQYCPYFGEMGLKNVKTQKQGTIDVYGYGDSPLRVAVEYCSQSKATSKTSGMYFAFDNPKLQMITSGLWEFDLFPHCPVKFDKKDIVFIYFIEFDDNLLQCEVVETSNNVFTFVHRKTTPLRHEATDLIYSVEYDSRINHKRNILKPTTPLEKKVAFFWKNDRVFYQSNEVGEVCRNYLAQCAQSGLY